MKRIPIRGLSREELRSECARLGEGEDRVRRLQTHLYKHLMAGFEPMTDISVSSRRRLAERFDLTTPEIVEAADSGDGTRKYRLRLADGQSVECVSIAYQERRRTLCLSTQVGCRMGCRFCATGTMGLVRQLRPHEIIDQAVVMLRDQPADRYNVVLMGMGEPLDNLDASIAALRIISAPWGLDRGPRNVTLSTIGIAPAIARVGQAPPQINLSLSVNAPDDELRAELMPATRKWTLDGALAELRRPPWTRDRAVVFVYVLLEGVNDSPDQARALARRLEGHPGMINLIPFNPVESIPFAAPGDETVDRFRQTLFRLGRPSHPRFSKGRHAGAACGQLVISARRTCDFQIETVKNKP